MKCRYMCLCLFRGFGLDIVKHKIITNGHYVFVRCGLFELMASIFLFLDLCTYKNVKCKMCRSQAYDDGFPLFTRSYRFKWVIIFDDATFSGCVFFSSATVLRIRQSQKRK